MNEDLGIEKNFLGKLNRGLSGLFNPIENQKLLNHTGIGEIFRVFSKLEERIRSGRSVTTDSFWQELTGDEQITEKIIEGYYRRLSTLILPLFIAYKKARGSMNPEKWWKSLPGQIKELIETHAPEIASTAKTREPIFPSRIQMVRSLPPLS